MNTVPTIEIEPSTSAKYLRVRCVECGWEDGLRTDCVAEGDTLIACDGCGDWRAWELIQL